MKRLPLEPEFLAPLPAEIDLRLVVTDMDGTLIDGEGRVPVGLNQVVAQMREAGILFVPASGRQLANIRAVLGRVIDDSPLIAESGALAVHGNEEIHSDTISAEDAAAAVVTTRELVSAGYDVGAVVACKRCAYIERSDPAFLAQARLYYEALEVVDDLMTVPLDEVLKVAVFDFDDVENGSSQALTAAVPNVQTAVSGTRAGGASGQVGGPSRADGCLRRLPQRSGPLRARGPGLRHAQRSPRHPRGGRLHGTGQHRGRRAAYG